MKYWQPYGITDPDAHYIDGDSSINRPGSIPPWGAIEQDQREIVSAIKGANMTPSATDLAQLLVAFRSQRMNYAVATNTAPNAIAVAFNPPIGDQVTPGLPLRVKAPLNNTGPCTMIVDNVSHALRRADGAELAANDIVANVPFECMWNDGGYWIITTFRGVGGNTSGDIINNTYITKLPYTTDVGTPNAIVANFTPPITAPIPGDAIEVRLANNITGPCTIKINALAPAPMVRPNGAPMQNGDAAADQVGLLFRSNTGTWQLTGVVAQAQAGFTLPPGSLVISITNVAIPGTLKLNGALLNRAEHPGLWGFANASTRIVDEAIWQAPEQRSWASFSRGDGAMTFRLPDFRAEFPRWWDDGRGQDIGRVLGLQQADDMRSHTHPIEQHGSVGGPGTFPTTGETGNANYMGSYGAYFIIDDLPSGGPDTRPRNCALVPCIVDG